MIPSWHRSLILITKTIMNPLTVFEKPPKSIFKGFQGCVFNAAGGFLKRKIVRDIMSASEKNELAHSVSGE